MSFLSRTKYLLVLFALGVAGCSSSEFTGDRGMSEVAKSTASSRAQQSPVRASCQGMDFSNRALSVVTARQLVQCLNANGSIPAYEALINRMSNQQLQALLDVVNHEIILNDARFRALDQQISDLQSSGDFDEILRRLGKLFAHSKAVASGLRLVHRAASPNHDGKIDADYLTAISTLTQELAAGKGARQNATMLIDTALDHMSLDSYQQILKALHLPIMVGKPALRMIAAEVLAYIQDKVAAPEDFGKPWLRGIADGSLYALFDHYAQSSREGRAAEVSAVKGRKPFRIQLKPLAKSSAKPSVKPMSKPVAKQSAAPSPKPSADSDSRIEAFERLIRYLAADHPQDVLAETARLYQAFNAPIECFDGTKQFPNANDYIFGKLVSENSAEVPLWAMHSDLVRLKLGVSSCNFPSDMNQITSVFKTMASSADGRQALVTISEFMKSIAAADSRLPIKRYQPLWIKLFADKSAQNIPKAFTSFLSEASRADRGLLSNVLYFIDAHDRVKARDLTMLLLKERPEFREANSDGLVASIYDVFAKGWLSLDAGTLGDALEGASELIDADEEFAKPLMQAVRKALWSSDAAPFLDVALEIGRKAGSEGSFFESLLEVSETAEFENALKLTASLAQDGKLKDILNGARTMLRGGPAPQPSKDRGAAPAFATTLLASRRAKSTATRQAWKPFHVNWSENADRAMVSCRELDLSTGLADTGNAEWAKQLQATVACSDTTERYMALQNFLRYSLEPARVVRGPQGAKTLPRFLTDAGVAFVAIGNKATRRKVIDEISDLLTDTAKFAELVNAREFFSFWFQNKFCTGLANGCSATAKLAPAQALFRMAGIFPNVREPVKDFLGLMARTLEDRRFPKAAVLLYDLADQAERYPVKTSSAKPALHQSILDQAVAMSSDLEGVSDHLDEAVQRKVNEYWTQVLSWDAVFGYSSSAAMKERMKPMMDTLGSGTTMENALRFFLRLNNDPYDPEWMASWMHRLASKVKPIPYYYPGKFPGKDDPTIRFVNQLDLLELIVAEADFTLRGIGMEVDSTIGKILIANENENPDDNFSLRYLTRLAQSGDHMQEWVDGLLRDLEHYRSELFFDAPSKMPGWTPGWAKRWAGNAETDAHNQPGVPEMRRRIFNLTQVAHVVEDLIAGHEVVYRGGRKLVRNDLGVLRDLFATILEATPPAYRNIYHKDVNSLVFIQEMVRFGVLRNIGTSIWEVAADGSNQPVEIAHMLRLMTDIALIHDRSGSAEVNSQTIEVFDFLLRHDSQAAHPKEFNEKYRLMGRVADTLYDWLGRRGSSAKHALYEASVVVGTIEKAASRAGQPFARELTTALQPWVGTQAGSEVFAKSLPLVEPIITSRKWASVLEYLAQAQGHDAFSKNTGYSEDQAFAEFSALVSSTLTRYSENGARLSKQGLELMQALENDPEGRFWQLWHVWNHWFDDRSYVSFRAKYWNRVEGSLLHGLLEGRNSIASMHRFQSYASQELQNGDVLALLEYFSAESKSKDQLYERMKFIGEPQYLDGFRSFLSELRSGLVDIAR